MSKEQRKFELIALAPDLLRERDQLRAENKRLNECLTAANFGDVPKGWDDALTQLAAERAIKAELVEALDNALNCMVPTGEDTRTDRAIVQGEAALARAREEGK